MAVSARRLRLGVVGLNHYHTCGWVESIELVEGDVEIVAIHDPDPELGRTLRPPYQDPSLSVALADRYRALPFYTDLDAMLSEQALDIALVTMPNRDIPAAMTTVARAGVHMLVDKPGARTAAEARPALEAVEAAGVKVGTGLTRHQAANFRDARAMIEAGRIGRIHSAEGILVSSSVRVRNPTNVLFDPDLMGGGVLHWLGVHDVDAVCWLLGDRPVEVRAQVATLSGEPIPVEDFSSMTVRFAGGPMASFHHVYVLPRRGMNEGYVAVRGTEGSVRMGSWGADLVWEGPGEDDHLERNYPVEDVPGYGVGGRDAVRDLVAAIREDRQPRSTYADLVTALEVIGAAYESSRAGGAPVRL